VTHLLATDGIAEQGPGLVQKSGPSQQQKGIRRGAKLLFLSAILFPLALALSIVVDGPAPLLIPLTIALSGGAMMLYARLFLEGALPSGVRQIPMQPNPYVPNAALPPASIPISSYRPPRLNTADMMERTSVVEHTTKLLGRDAE
jgi:hypothetical protein